MTLVFRLGRLALASVIAAASYFVLYRPLQIDWGATAAEVGRSMPGDALIEAPLFRSTRAISIAAPPERVWPWVAQIGATGIGWYSYDLVDNRSRPSAERIIPERAHSVGSRLAVGKDREKSFYVRALEEPRWMLVSTGAAGMTWAWELVPGADGSTRLLSRLRMRGGWTSPLAIAAVDAGDFVMMRQMMKGVRDRAEGRRARSFASLTAEFLLWVACFAGFVVAEIGLVVGRRWQRHAVLATLASAVTIGLVMCQPPVWVDALGAVSIIAGLVGIHWRRRPTLAPAGCAAGRQ